MNHFQKADEYYWDGINILKNHLRGENEFGINANIRRAENLARFGKYYAAVYHTPKFLTETDSYSYQNILNEMNGDPINDENFDSDNSIIRFLSAERVFHSYITNSVDGSRIRPEMEVIYCSKDDTEQIRGDEETDAEPTLFH